MNYRRSIVKVRGVLSPRVKHSGDFCEPLTDPVWSIPRSGTANLKRSLFGMLTRAVGPAARITASRQIIDPPHTTDSPASQLTAELREDSTTGQNPACREVGAARHRARNQPTSTVSLFPGSHGPSGRSKFRPSSEAHPCSLGVTPAHPSLESRRTNPPDLWGKS